MTNDEFDALYDNSDELMNLHCDYIMENCHGDRIIGNGDMLINAIEDGYLYEEFREVMIPYIEMHPNEFSNS